MELDMTRKVVIVTGGGSNIGRAIVHGFAREGCNVAIAEIDEDQGRKVADQVNTLKGGGKTITVKTDVTNWPSCQAMAKKTLDEFGRIDVLVNDVGWTEDALFTEKTRESWEREIAINFWSFVNCTRAVLDHMTAQKSGSIVSIGSDAGRLGEYKEAVYGGCKAAVIATSKAIAREVGRYGIRLNVVCPGATFPASMDDIGKHSLWKGAQGQFLDPEIQAKMMTRYPLKKLCKAEDIANAVVFLASPAAGFITGQTLSVSGGYSMM